MAQSGIYRLNAGDEKVIERHNNLRDVVKWINDNKLSPNNVISSITDLFFRTNRSFCEGFAGGETLTS